MMFDVTHPEFLAKIFDYDPATGLIFWKERWPDLFCNCQNPERQCAAWNKAWAGREAFTSFSNGYKQTNLLGNKLSGHRVGWSIYHNQKIIDQIDHINGIRHDNRILNLRLASIQEQRRNSAIPRTNTSGFAGVSYYKPTNKWRATITVDKKAISLGYYYDIEEAKEARRAAEAEYGFHKNHNRKLLYK